MIRRNGVFAIACLILISLLALAVMNTAGPGTSSASSSTENLRTLAKLYGYLRYFNPSDEAARVDWDALAVLAVEKIKSASDAQMLKAELERVFRPVAPAMLLYFKDEKPSAASHPPITEEAAAKLVSWQHYGMGLGSGSDAYKSVRLNRPYDTIGTTGMVQSLDAAPARGKTIKMTAWIKALPKDKKSEAQLWLRVIGPSDAVSGDYVPDRPIKAAEWSEYTITGPVAADAKQIAFGIFVGGRGKFFFDDFRLSAIDASGREEPLAIQNGGFEEKDAKGAPKSWSVYRQTLDVKIQEDEFREGKHSLSIASKVQPFAEPLFKKRAPADRLIEKEIGLGIFCRIPLALASEANGTLPRSDPKDMERLEGELAEVVSAPFSAQSENVRLADVLIAWNIFQHFYPYFDVVKVDWDEVLTQTLERARSDRTEDEFRKTLRWMVARLQDGHAGVYSLPGNPMVWAPFRAEWVEGKAVITFSQEANLRRGDILLALDGKELEDVIREKEEYISGSPQWKRVQSMASLSTGAPGAISRLKILRDGQTLEVEIKRPDRTTGNFPSEPPSHPPIDKLAEGIFYVDLTRAPWEDINARIQEIASARGVIFDLRGYPKGNHMILGHLLSGPDTSSAWMRVPLIVFPDREAWDYEQIGWNLSEKKPHIGGRVVFLTNSRAISYSESVMGFVEHYKLGEIVGEPTAGANGDVNSFTLPGGFNVNWTGLKVVRHDGSQQHIIGILPTIPCHRTIAGIVAAKDEFLEKALEVVKK